MARELMICGYLRSVKPMTEFEEVKVKIATDQGKRTIYVDIRDYLRFFGCLHRRCTSKLKRMGFPFGVYRDGNETELGLVPRSAIKPRKRSSELKK